MEAKRLSKVQRFDAITTLPEAILEAILCLLPIEEAARTSILSKEWRYIWTKIPKVVFLEDTVKDLTGVFDWNSLSETARRNTEMSSKLFHVILQVLYMRRGQIHEFTCEVAQHFPLSDIDQIILHLVRNHPVKKLKLDFSYAFSNCGLPLSVFSLPHLTDLDLKYCEINDKPIFSRFGSLSSLTLNRVTISRETLLQLLSNCPSLKSLYLLVDKRVVNHETPNIAELFKCLPLIEKLTTWDYVFESFAIHSVPQELPTSLNHLKYLCFEDMGLGNNYGFTSLAFLVKCSPNMEKIKIQIDADKYNKLDEYSFKLEEYSGVRLENLNELEIVNFRNLKCELEFVKFIMARSPNLKKVILLTFRVKKKEKQEIIEILLNTRRASKVKIIVENFYNLLLKRKKNRRL